MLIPINLASQPFRKDRPILAAGFVTAGILTILLGFLIVMIVSNRRQLKGERHEIADLEARLRVITQEQGQINAQLRRPDNEAVFERNVMLNTLIDRKSISWTRIFADLEKVMPGNVRLISVRLPQITNQNQVLLDMVVGAQEQAPIVDLLRRFESSPVFGATTVHSFQPPTQNEPLYRYRVSVNYTQQL
jgi:type IV pilus assembly protein PilN